MWFQVSTVSILCDSSLCQGGVGERTCRSQSPVTNVGEQTSSHVGCGQKIPHLTPQTVPPPKVLKLSQNKIRSGSTYFIPTSVSNLPFSLPYFSSSCSKQTVSNFDFSFSPKCQQPSRLLLMISTKWLDEELRRKQYEINFISEGCFLFLCPAVCVLLYLKTQRL